MKKRLRQVQLDMTKLRARQAEVSKEVQNSPAVGEPFFLFKYRRRLSFGGMGQ